MDCTRKSVLIVGAGGFVGGGLAEEGLRRGLDVWCGVRASTSRRYLQDSRLRFVTFDFDKPETLAQSMLDVRPEGGWDYIIYNLGATKCLSFTDFNRINYRYLQSFTDALKQAELVPQKMLFISSLSVMGPKDERGFTPFTEADIPQPNTRYGASKLKAEMWLKTAGIPTIVFRCTGIYGPRDKDYFLEFKALQTGFDFSVGLCKQLLTFLYVDDLCRAAYQALESAPVGETYILSEPRAYTQAEFRKIVAKVLGKKVVIPMKMPLWAVKAVSTVAEKWGVLRMKPSTLNRDKFNIMKQRNWTADISAARRDFGFEPRIDLEEGVRRSIEWYRKEGWLK